MVISEVKYFYTSAVRVYTMKIQSVTGKEARKCVCFFGIQ
jgi:hypothetical protein